MPDCQLLADLAFSPTQEYSVIGMYSTIKDALADAMPILPKGAPHAHHF